VNFLSKMWGQNQSRLDVQLGWMELRSRVRLHRESLDACFA